MGSASRIACAASSGKEVVSCPSMWNRPVLGHVRAFPSIPPSRNLSERRGGICSPNPARLVIGSRVPLMTGTTGTVRTGGIAMTVRHQLECRIIITRPRHSGERIAVGMYDPLSGKYQPLGEHGPDEREIDRVVRDLAQSIERAGHRLTWCERSA